jgi:DNA-damage-inducible protein D
VVVAERSEIDDLSLYSARARPAWAKTLVWHDGLKSATVVKMSDTPNFLEVFDGDSPLFEESGRPNGVTTWSARALATFLGYKDYTTFKAVINRTQQALIAIDADASEHVRQEVTIDADGKKTMDLRLSRFACYLAAMNGDPKKKQVAHAQAYFAKYSMECQQYLDDIEQVERVVLRDDISEHEKSLSATAVRAGVREMALFKNAGYRGLYNMNLADLRKLKGVPENRSPLDFMGKDELAANSFRITQTDAKIKRDKLQGQAKLECVAEDVGKMVRHTMAAISGQKPENLPKHEDIRKVRLGFKHAGEIIKTTPLTAC